MHPQQRRNKSTIDTLPKLKEQSRNMVPKLRVDERRVTLGGNSDQKEQKEPTGIPHLSETISMNIQPQLNDFQISLAD